MGDELFQHPTGSGDRHGQQQQVRPPGCLGRIKGIGVDAAPFQPDLEVGLGPTETDHLADQTTLAGGQPQRAADQTDPGNNQPIKQTGHEASLTIRSSASIKRSFSDGVPTLTRA